MQLTAYWVGSNVVAARSEEGAVQVMARHEPPGRWALGDVSALSAVDLSQRVSAGAPETFAQALAAADEPQLILWDFNGA